MLVETSDVCNADGVFVVVSSVAMGTDVFQRTASFDVAVFKNDIVISDVLESASTMKSTEVCHRQFASRPVGCAMYDYLFYLKKWNHND